MGHLRIDMAEFLTLAIVVVLFGTSTFLRKMAVDGMNPFHLQAISTAVYLGVLPMWMAMGPRWVWPPISTGMLAVAAVLTNVVGAVIFGFLLKASSSPTALAAAASTSPVITAVLAYLFLGEVFTPKKLWGVAFVLVGMVLFNT